MIGQKSLTHELSELWDSGNFPRFAILEGKNGSGRRTIINEVFKGKLSLVVLEDNKVDTIRLVIEQSYKQTDPIMYVLINGDSMSLQAKNALLKVTEEPPQLAYFVMLLEDRQNTLDTIRSRGTIFSMEHYTPQEIEDFAIRCEPTLKKADLKILVDVCEVPQDVTNLLSFGIKVVDDFVHRIFENIDRVHGANALKLSNDISTKEGDGKIDLEVFWKLFSKECLDHYNDKDFGNQYCVATLITNSYLMKLKTQGINKQNLFDMWVLEIRKAWMDL